MEWAILPLFPSHRASSHFVQVLISHPAMGRRLSWPGCLVTYWGGMPTWRLTLLIHPSLLPLQQTTFMMMMRMLLIVCSAGGDTQWRGYLSDWLIIQWRRGSRMGMNWRRDCSQHKNWCQPCVHTRRFCLRRQFCSLLVFWKLKTVLNEWMSVCLLAYCFWCTGCWWLICISVYWLHI